jgi:hypothetical protein
MPPWICAPVEAIQMAFSVHQPFTTGVSNPAFDVTRSVERNWTNGRLGCRP